MKNRFLTLLTVTMLTGSILVGCGGTETGADNGGSGTNTESNMNSVETEETEETEKTEETEQKEMSAEAEAYLDKIKEIAEQVNAEREEIKKDYPDADVPVIVEVESKDGLELLTNFPIHFDDAELANNTLEIIRIFFRTDVYDKYYIEYVRETSSLVEFNLYCTKQ